MTLDDREHGAKVKKALTEERTRKVNEVNERIEREQEEREHERALGGEDSESRNVESAEERKRARHRARMERIMDALHDEDTNHDFYALAHCTEKDDKGDVEPARFKMLQESRQHKRAFVAAAKVHYHVTRSKTKAIRSELEPLEGEPSYQEWVDGWKKNHRFPKLPPLEVLAVEDMAPPPPEPEPETDVFVDTSGLPAASTNNFTLPAIPAASESNDTVPDTSDMPTPTMRTRSLARLESDEDDLEDADEGTVEAPVAESSHQRETEIASDTVNTANRRRDFTAFTFAHRIAFQSAAGSSQPPAVPPTVATRRNGGGGAGNRELRVHGGDAGVAGPSRQATGRSGTRAGRGRTKHATHIQVPPPRRSARHAARSIEQTDTGSGQTESSTGNAEPDTSNAAAEPDTGKKRKAPASDPEKGYEKKKKKKRRGDGGQ
ncbi:hypothetical protein CYLTODRAFT_494911 [Cylindrobasidium torrendii FP15055 ss-10]|uniref:Uncharacterized protein n=1 Tax=Cylindrobasidium torrendii FP15055 ss-10 TaxID=1314674 RepID=A0A0D7AVJ8_9AGAR|nr:hypothetical protein CYLTODRAFT_494911 [Cylindrobasidium torrendii FP15055 ss-10]